MPEEYTPNVHIPGEVGAEPEVQRPRRDPIDPADSPQVDKDPETIPLALLGDPPIVSELELDELYNKDIDGIRKKVDYIDLIIKKIILEKDWKPNVKSYKDVLNEYFSKLGLGENDTSYTKLRKLYMYLYLPAVL